MTLPRLDGERKFEDMTGYTLGQSDRLKFVMDAFGWSPEDEMTTRKKNIIEEIATVWDRGLGARAGVTEKDSLWHMFNTVTEYVDHGRTVRGGNGRLKSTQFGSGAQVKERAFKNAVALMADGTEQEVKVEQDLQGSEFSDLLNGSTKL